MSGFKDITAALSYDGSGDAVSVMLAKCEDTEIEVLERVFLPVSLGHFYSAVCNFIGFDKFGEEYKVMGLSAYGDDKYSTYFDSLIGYDEKNVLGRKICLTITQLISIKIILLNSIKIFFKIRK